MSLLYLVEKQYRKRRVPYCVRELTSRLVAHISRRRSKQLLVAVRLAVLAHIEPDTAAIVAEKLRRKRLCGLGFTRAGRSCKEKHSLWPGVGASLESGKSGHCALYHVKRAYYRRVLTLHAAAEVLLGAAQLLYVKAAPRILTNTVFVEVDNSAHVLHLEALVLTELPQTVQLREAETLGQRRKSLLNRAKLIAPGTVPFHAPAVVFRCKERREIPAADELKTLIAGGSADGYRLFVWVIKVEPRRDIVRLIDRKDQQIPQLAAVRPHLCGIHHRLQKRGETVDLRLLKPLRRGYAPGREVHHNHAWRSVLRESALYQPGSLTGAESCFNKTAADLRACQLGKSLGIAALAGIIEPTAAVIEHNAPVAHVLIKIMEIVAEPQYTSLRNASLVRKLVAVQDIPLQHYKGLYAAEYLKLAVPFRGIRHVPPPLLCGKL